VPYSTDSDLAAIRPNIVSLAPTPPANWNAQRAEAEDLMLRDLNLYWYRAESDRRFSLLGWTWNGLSSQKPIFDPAKLTTPGQLKRLSCYRTLALIYLFLQKDQKDPDAFERERSLFERLYQQELSAVAEQGLDYDWASVCGSTIPAAKERRLERG
jgi:hypothetical protein